MDGCEVKNRTKVRTPEGWIGQIETTRNQRAQIAFGRVTHVTVRPPGGKSSIQLIKTLNLIPEEDVEDVCEMFARCVGEVISGESYV